MTPAFLALCQTHDLGEGYKFFTGRLPAELVWDAATLQQVWQLHPAKKHMILIHGRWVETPRWQQAFDFDYVYTNQTNKAEPRPSLLSPVLAWVQKVIDPRLNGILVNWYEGPDHYIGEHHDSIKNMVRGAEIATISFGETRMFRLSLGKGEGREVRDFPASHGIVFSMPFNTNLRWKHSVPKSARYAGRRISVTFRAFVSGKADSNEAAAIAAS